MNIDLKKFIDGVHDYLSEQISPLLKRVEALENQKLPAAIKGDVGEKGERGEKGEQGAVGRDGRDGKNGRDGKDGKDGVQGEKGPQGEKGERGEKGEKGERGEKGEKGERGIQGEKGLTGDKGERGPQGDKGKDGLGFDDMSAEQIDERTLSIKFIRGDMSKSFEIKMPVVIYRDVYQADKEYEEGDAVTWGGSLWIARASTKDKPGTSDNWRLAVKKGRDGKNGECGEKGERGVKGEKGERGYPA